MANRLEQSNLNIMAPGVLAASGQPNESRRRSEPVSRSAAAYLAGLTYRSVYFTRLRLVAE